VHCTGKGDERRGQRSADEGRGKDIDKGKRWAEEDGRGQKSAQEKVLRGEGKGEQRLGGRGQRIRFGREKRAEEGEGG
jgi:hypothetical protein